jgi:hypothetical protein
MTIQKWATLALLALPFLAGCKGFWDAPSTSGTGTGTTTASSGNFYVLNAKTSQIAGYYINAGVVTALTGSPYTVPALPIAIALAPNNAFLYVSTANGIYDFTIASNGELSLGNSSAPISSDQAVSMQVDASNSWLVESVSGASLVYAHPHQQFNRRSYVENRAIRRVARLHRSAGSYLARQSSCLSRHGCWRHGGCPL